ncbi:hypothetical protein TNCT_40261 [Trichonephila clavata]|uniref:Uncharacterized protein n=1 Tax=Trichonephila clavata TaxID=2740835 RepID=A0A8X6G3W8_TRICU|nr:hypothetical protein TNCT_40261 [Trichonephila clavata]
MILAWKSVAGRRLKNVYTVERVLLGLYNHLYKIHETRKYDPGPMYIVGFSQYKQAAGCGDESFCVSRAVARSADPHLLFDFWLCGA